MTTASDTIFARGTVAGEAALAVLRLSGPETQRVIAEVFRPHKGPKQALEARKMHLGQFVDGQDQLIDVGLLAFFPGPRSYTGEDVAEFHLHGSELVVELLYQRLSELGLRLARPGEFTRRAFLNNKMDLAQAESVIQVIHAGSRSALDAAHRTLKGELSQTLVALKSQCLEIIRWLELSIDFPEEDISQASDEELLEQIQHLWGQASALMRGCSDGEALRRGIYVALIGVPNAGKSSLLNALVGQSKALVSDIAGTTRDVVESHIRLGGERIVLQDTAGIRESLDPIEQMGVARSESVRDNSDIMLLVVDAALEASEHSLGPLDEDSTLLILNKADLGVHRSWKALRDNFPGLSVVEASTVAAPGIEPVVDFLRSKVILRRQDSADAIVLTDWQRSCISTIVEELQGATDSVELGLSPEATAIHLYAVMDVINGFLGADSQDEVLDEIFANFCLGK